MENIAPRVGIELTSLVFWASVLTITPHMAPDVTYPFTAICLCEFLSQRSMQTTTPIP